MRSWSLALLAAGVGLVPLALGACDRPQCPEPAFSLTGPTAASGAPGAAHAVRDVCRQPPIGYAIVAGTALATTGERLAARPVFATCPPWDVADEDTTDAAGEFELRLRFRPFTSVEPDPAPYADGRFVAACVVRLAGAGAGAGPVAVETLGVDFAPTPDGAGITGVVLEAAATP